MFVILFYIFEWIFILILILVLLLMFIWMWTALNRKKTPFVSVPTSILPTIYELLEIKEGSIVYDLGCGDARVLAYCAKLQPKARYIGIENGLFPFILAETLSWWNKKRGRGDVEIIYKNFFDVDLSNATHIFTYLYPNIMDDLRVKFDEELKGGQRMVSSSFKFTQKPFIAEVDLNRGKYQLARKLFVYEF